MDHRYLKIGHRGFSVAAPENTMSSFRKAMAAGVDGIELDVHLTRDNRLAVLHDERVGRTVRARSAPEAADARTPAETKPLFVRDLTLAQLQEYSAGEWFGPEYTAEVVPSLDEVLELARGRIRLFIELKAGSFFYPGIEQRLVDCLREREMMDSVQVSSFDHHALVELRRIEPVLSTATLISCRPIDPVGIARAARADAIHPFHGFVTPAFLEETHRAGLSVYTWTVDDAEEMRRLASWGIDGIMSNHVELIP